jgi:hypothetical protein
MATALISLGRTALVIALAGAAGSIGFMLYAGRRNPSRILVLLFAVWVLSPFAAAVLAWANSERWSAFTRSVLYGAMLAVALVPLCIYGTVALGHKRAKVGFVFLVVPLLSWLVLAIAVLLATVHARRARSRA